MDTNQSDGGTSALPQIETLEIIELLGQGGMSKVYKARQQGLDRLVAVKVLQGSAIKGEESIKRFQKEARLTSALSHPNIVKTLSFGVSQNGQPYLVMEYLEGVSLAQELKNHGRLKLRKFRDFFLPALSALGQAHMSGLVHRDIKPGNIMICRDDRGEETVKLVDFGIAKVFGDNAEETLNLTKSGSVLGSPTYMSPEQCQGKALDGRSDLYSLSCVMYEALMGEPPFSGETLLEVMQKHSSAAPPTVSELSRKIDIKRELANVTLWGLAKDPAERPQTAAEFSRKLAEVLGRITLDRVPSLRKWDSKVSKKTFLFFAVFVVSAFLVWTVAGLMMQKTKEHTSSTLAELNKNIDSTEGSQEERLKQRLERKRRFGGLQATEAAAALAEYYNEQHRFSDAEPVLEFSLPMVKALAQRDNKSQLALAKNDFMLAFCYFQQGVFCKAHPLFVESYDIRKRILGTHKDTEDAKEYSKYTITRLDSFVGDPNLMAHAEKSVPRFLNDLKSDQATFGSENPRTIPALLGLVEQYEMSHQWHHAEDVLNRVLSIQEKSNESEMQIVQTLLRLGRSFAQDGDLKKAESNFAWAIKILEKYPESAIKALAKIDLGAIYLRQSKYDLAEKIEKQATEMCQHLQYLQDDPLTIEASDYLSESLIKQKKYAEAEPLITRNLEYCKPTISIQTYEESIRYAVESSRLGQCLSARNKNSDSIVVLNRAKLALDSRNVVYGPDYKFLCQLLADCYDVSGDTAQAKTLRTRATNCQPTYDRRGSRAL